MKIQNQKRLILRIQQDRRVLGDAMRRSGDPESVVKGQALLEEAEALACVLDSLRALEAVHTALAFLVDSDVSLRRMS